MDQAGPPNLGQVEAVLNELYGNSSPGVKRGAQTWLLQFQRSSFAWQISFNLLSAKTVEAQYFGAQTLQAKISKDWDELPEDQQVGLRGELLKKAAEFCRGSPMVLTRISVAIAAIALQTYPHKWPNMFDEIFQVLATLGNELGVDTRIALLEFLIVLPEEVSAATFVQARKKIIYAELATAVSKVIPTLTFFLDTANSVDQGLDSELRKRALKALKSWTAFGIPIDDMKPVVTHVLALVSNPTYFELAIDALVEFVTHPGYTKYAATVCTLIPYITAKKAEFTLATQNGDLDTCMGLSRFMISLGESFPHYLVNNFSTNQDVQQLLAMILDCTNFPGSFPVDQEISSMPLNFWFQLTENCLDNEDRPDQKLLQPMLPVFISLCQILCHKAEYPADFNEWPKDDQDDFNQYRRDLGDTFIYVCGVLKAKTLEVLMYLLNEEAKKVLQQPQRWQPVEAVLFALRSIAESLDPEDQSEIPALFDLVFTLSSTVRSPKVSYTCILLIGAYSEWLRSQPQHLSQVLSFVLTGFDVPELSSAAAISLSDISEACHEEMQPSLGILVNHYKMLKPFVKTRERVIFIETIGNILQSMPGEVVSGAVQTLLEEITQEVSRSMAEMGNKNPQVIREHILGAFKQLIGCLKNLKTTTGQDPAADLLQPTQVMTQSHHMAPVLLGNLWTCIKAVTTAWIQDEEIIKDVCLLLNHVIRILEGSMATHFSLVSQLLIQSFQHHQQPSFLTTAAMLVGIFGSHPDPSSTLSLADLLLQLSMTTFTSLQSDMAAKSELIQQYFGLLTRYLRACPKAILELQTPLLPTIFQLSLTVLNLQEKESVVAATNFITEFLLKEYPQPAQTEIAKSIIAQFGEAIIQETMLAIAGRHPRSTVPTFATLLVKFRDAYPEPLRLTLAKLFSEPTFPSTMITPDDKTKFIKDVFETRHSSRFKDMAREFSVKCRGLENTAFGEA